MSTIHHLIKSVQGFYVFFSSLFVFALLCRLPYLLSIFTSISKATRKQPHLIFILADDLVSNFCRGKQFSQHFAFLEFWGEKGKNYTKFTYCRVFIVYSSFIHYCIFSGSQGWDDVGFHGSRQIPTPNIDAMATEGVILNNYYVSPMCTPTRASIMSGKHPIHLGRLQYNCSHSLLSNLQNKETKNSAQRYRNASKETRVIKLEARIFGNG